MFSASLHTSKQLSEFPEASTPNGALPAEQLVPFAASAVAVPALPDHVPEVSRVSVELEPPTFTTGLESERGEEAVKVVVAADDVSPLVPLKSKPCERDGRKRLLLKVEEAVENRPLRKPSVVEVELPQLCGVNGNVPPPPPQEVVVRRLFELRVRHWPVVRPVIFSALP